jgi:RNA-binding protein NOB1
MNIEYDDSCTTTTTSLLKNNIDTAPQMYQFLVVDSGPIIRLSGGSQHHPSSLWRQAQYFYTVPAVLNEIRDAKARQHLENLPCTLRIRSASPEGIQAIVAFARQTGDYNSLSSVDIQVLGLLYDLEREGCLGDMSHVRTTPKRTLGLGKIESLGPNIEPTTVVEANDYIVEGEGEGDNDDDDDDDSTSDNLEDTVDDNESELEPIIPDAKIARSWASILNPTGMSTVSVPTDNSHIFFTKLEEIASYDNNNNNDTQSDSCSGGQFSDAEDDDVNGILERGNSQSDESDDGDEQINSTVPGNDMENELQSDFPSLAVSLLVPYDDNDPKGDHSNDIVVEAVGPDDQLKEDEERKLRSLQPISKSGKLYNSFTRYKHLMTPNPVSKVPSTTANPTAPLFAPSPSHNDDDNPMNNRQSRIIGGTSFAGQGDDVEDDGEGWITNSKEISSMKAAGALDPCRNPKDVGAASVQPSQQGPLICHRAACATTDFAMQNVILQMNLELLSVDGMKVRKLKTWVTRCGACFTVYTNSDNPGPLGKRLFCERCGSDVMQRIAASVDGKTGRLRLHLSKRYQHNLRGTKFSLPKPGSGNRFQGDLLLREDQLLMGAWSQKVKMISGGKARDAAQSIFGRDIATNVGCHANAVSADDIRVGFGRRNPNAAKGRERRGKKKKTADKACGLRRY